MVVLEFIIVVLNSNMVVPEFNMVVSDFTIVLLEFIMAVLEFTIFLPQVIIVFLSKTGLQLFFSGYCLVDSPPRKDSTTIIIHVFLHNKSFDFISG